MFGYLDHRADLFHGELCLRRGVLLAHDSTGGADLDEVRPLPEDIAGRLHALRRSVTDAGVLLPGPVIGEEMVFRVASRNGQDIARGQDPRTPGGPLVDSTFDVKGVRAAAVLHGGESRVEEPSRIDAGPEEPELLRHRDALLDEAVRLQAHQVQVGIDEARHHRLSSHIEKQGIVGNLQLLSLTHAGDDRVLNDDGHVLDGVAPGAIDQPPTLNYQTTTHIRSPRVNVSAPVYYAGWQRSIGVFADAAVFQASSAA